MKILIIFGLFCFFNLSLSGQKKPEAFLANLLEKMTLEEKVGQMTQISISEIIDESSLEGWEKSGKLSIDVEKLKPFIKDYHVGSFLNGYAVESAEWSRFINELQGFNANYNRHGIPIIFGINHIHGATYAKNATIFPQAISLACSFNPQLARKMGEVTVHESGHLGHRWVFNPVMDLGRNKFSAAFLFDGVRNASLENVTLVYETLDFEPVDFESYDHEWEKRVFHEHNPNTDSLFVTSVWFENAKNCMLTRCNILKAGNDPVRIRNSRHIT